MGKSAAEIVAPLFKSAHGALVFAFNFSGQCYDRPLMNRMATPVIGSGKGLAGLDGAAQAGMIRAEVQALGKLHEAILIARTAPRSNPCSCRSSCCSGRKPNKEWVDAVAWLADHVRNTALAGCTADYRIRRGCVEMFFGSSLTVTALADKCDVARNTAGAHFGKVRKLLKDEESRAQIAVEDRLRAAGMVGA